MTAITLNTILDQHALLCTEARELLARKNADYAHGPDPFRNFRTFGRMGILVRLSDKLSRLQSLTEKGSLPAVRDESLHDTILDVINYVVLFATYPED